MKDKSVIIIPFILPWNWSADYQKQTSLELAKNHKVIAYMQKDAIFFLKAIGNRSVVSYPTHKNISFYRPLYILPFRRIQIIEKLNQTISFVLFQLSFVRLHSFVLWIFDPFFYFMPKATTAISLYDCVDYHPGFHKDKKFIDTQEKEKILIKSVDYFFVNSHVLYELHQKIREPDAVVPQGFRLKDFQSPVKTSMQCSDEKPIIGYVGVIDSRLDLVLVQKLILKNPQWQFVLWGSLEQRLTFLHSLPNVIIGESKDRREVASIIKQFDVGIIPFDTTQPGVRYCYPMKLFEYFYVGKPVVSTLIDELERFPNYVRMGKTATEWEKHISFLLSHPWPKNYHLGQRKLAMENSWEKKLAIIFGFLRRSKFNILGEC